MHSSDMDEIVAEGDHGRQLALTLVDPTEPRILPQDGNMWFSVCHYGGDRMRQCCYRLALIEPILRSLRHAIDTYLSQGIFAIPSRRSVHIAWLTHSYVDLDTYKSDKWSSLPPDEVLREIMWHCSDAQIPPPSIILSSGRGFYCKWFWTKPVPRVEAGRAVAVNRALCQALAAFNADPRACDLSRILRVTGTVNSKNRGLVNIVWLNGSPGEPTTYDFDEFALELPQPEISNFVSERPPYCNPSFTPCKKPRSLSKSWREGRRFPREHWHWGVLEDVRTLAALRYPGGIVQPGMRDLFGHVAACQLARVINPGPLFHEIVAIARTFLPGCYVLSDEFRHHCSTLLRRATHAAEGGLVTFRGRSRSPIYTYSKARLIDLLEITPEEEALMTRLISDAEKRRRGRERRRDAGTMARAEYEAVAAARRPMITAMRMRGMTWRAIADQLGISPSEAYRLGVPRCSGSALHLLLPSL